MGEFRHYLFSKTSTETDFFQDLFDIICDLGDDITIENASGEEKTVAEIYDETQSGYWVNLFLNFHDGGPRLEMFRTKLSDAAKVVYFQWEGVTRDNNVTFASGANYYGSVSERSFQFAYYKGENSFFFWLGNYNSSQGITNMAMSLGRIKVDDDYAIAWGWNYNVIGLTYNLGGSTSCSFVSSLPYSAGAGNIDYADFSIFGSSGTKLFSCNDIKACSTVPAFSNISLPDGKNYFAIGTNAMVEVS